MPFEFERVSVPLSAVNSEIQPFRITTSTDLQDIVKSLKRVGLITPPIVIPDEHDQFTIVCGHRRVAAAGSLGWTVIPARVLARSTDKISCALLSIGENIAERPLNLLETSRALSLISEHEPDQGKFQKIIEEIGLPHTRSIVKKMLHLCKLPEAIQEGITSGTLALPSALMLSEFQDESAVLIARFLINLRLSLHKQREVIGFIEEIAANEGISYESLLSSKSITDVLNDPGMDIPRKAGLIRSYLKKRRYPNLSAAQTAFEHLKSELKIGDNATLIPPAGFESNRHTLSFTFSTITDLKKQAENIERLSKNEQLDRYLSGRTQ